MIDQFKNEYRFLSNFWVLKNPIEIEGFVFDSSEAAYQAMKTLDAVTRGKFQELTPSESKKFGKTLQIREDWNEIKIQIMEKIVQEKFHKNPEIAQKLIETYPQQLVEGNWWGDTFWGVDIKSHSGQNHLGKILMKIRGEIMQKEMSSD
ncbi:MAG: NADAR family protein [Syntrophorhabdaceae bacterium]